SAASFPVTITGTIGTATDVDYFAFSLAAGQSVSMNLMVPSTKDYDLYLYATSGSYVARSINAGNGVPESIRYANPGAQATYYAQVKGYQSAFSATLPYTLIISKQ